MTKPVLSREMSSQMKTYMLEKRMLTHITCINISLNMNKSNRVNKDVNIYSWTKFYFTNDALRFKINFPPSVVLCNPMNFL